MDKYFDSYLYNTKEGIDLKKVILSIVGTIMVLASAALVLYPFISNYLMSLNQQAEVSAFQDYIDNADKDMIANALKDAQEYNKSLYGHVIITDPFDPNFKPVFDKEYDSLLNLKGDGVMGYVDIPSIDVTLPIYHGTSDDVLAKGAGHLQNTSLPVGGIGTHAVLTGHTGLTTARLFTDINQLKAGDEKKGVKGDVFLIHVLDITIAYEVDQIKVVEPSETDDLKIDTEHDYVTLVTCTPYGINSHRLLVRGKRIPYTEKEESEIDAIERVVESTWMLEYKKAVFAGFILLLILLAIIITISLIVKHRKKKKLKKVALVSSENENAEQENTDTENEETE